MKGIVIGFILLITLNGCFVYENTTSWKQTPSSFEEFQSKTLDYTKLRTEVELTQPARMLYFPFLFVIYSKKKEFYTPTLQVSTNDSAIGLSGFKYLIYDINGNKVIADSVHVSTKLNKFLDYNALVSSFGKQYQIVGLKEKKLGERMMIDYELTLSYSEGRKQKFYFKQKELIKTKRKEFGSFL
jgi:outer membrane lipoprotein-sorting protein